MIKFVLFISIFSIFSIFSVWSDEKLIIVKDKCGVLVEQILRNVSQDRAFHNSLKAKMNGPIGAFSLQVLRRLEVKHDYTFFHSLDVAQIAIKTGYHLGYSVDDLMTLLIAGFMHDAGKHYIDIEILGKNGKLTESEYSEMKYHPQALIELMDSYEHSLPKNLRSYWRKIKNVATQHHERVDGRGYPLGLVGNEITNMGGILSRADSWSTIRSHRAYDSKEKDKEVAIQRLEEGIEGNDSRFSGQFYRRDVEAFVQLVREGKVDSHMISHIRDMKSLNIYLGKDFYSSSQELVSDLDLIFNGHFALNELVDEMELKELESWIQNLMNKNYFEIGFIAGNDFNLKTSTTYELQVEYYKRSPSDRKHSIVSRWREELISSYSFRTYFDSLKKYVENYSLEELNDHLYRLNESVMAYIFLDEWIRRLEAYSPEDNLN